ncbi:polysaccharide biosynthesis tyrosine autokinase [Thermophagus xiamenensis]|uniref:non-specific protein-tyrosine kinase n=1 Tax=Thermophagus xiamenensis TaxID=385682 RepID=A0A1I2B4L8_9BACT|nr:tyrosine-protein kinase [Thermophagus xiamenensis]SFE51111.1 protein involved in gliding motility EpsB [Thermophagus xiamenensis]
MNRETNRNTIKGLQADNTTQFMLDYRKLLHDLITFWWLFAITIPLALGIVFIIHRYSTPIYQATMSILMEERGSDRSQDDMMEGFGLTPGQRNMDNQIAVLTSRDMIRKTIDQLDFHISYFAAGRLKDTEIYPNPGFVVELDSTASQIINVPIYITILDSQRFEISVKSDTYSSYSFSGNYSSDYGGAIDFDKIYAFNEWIDTPWLKARIVNLSDNLSAGKEYYFTIRNPESLTAQYYNILKAKKAGENSTIVHLSVTGPNHQKNIAFLKKLSETFINANLEKKNQIATNTINFIEEQLLIISDSLAKKGTQLSNFRTQNQIQDISSEAQHLFNQIQELSTRISEKKLTLNYFDYLENYFAADSILEKRLAPATFEINNPIIEGQITKIIDLNNERLTLNGQQNPYKYELDKQILVARNTLLEAIYNQKEIISEAIHRLQNEKIMITRQLYLLPEKERKLLGIERQFDLNNEVYTFLLRKRSEAQIQKASNTPDHTVLEMPRYAGMVSPQKSANRQKALFLGIFIPLAYIVLRQLINNKITTPDELEHLSSKPIIGHIIHSPKEVANIIANHPRSVIAETFRRVRTRLEYLTAEAKTPVIAVSSSMPGEGKTFCALNLAAVFAYSGKKTILLGFDMRKPGLNKIFDLNGNNGLSHYFIGKSTIEDITYSGHQENLEIIPSGVIPPNPSELISSHKTDELINELKNKYDIIILDTPPMGIVADPILLARKADTLVFLVRQNFTIKEAFIQTLNHIEDEGIKSVGVLFNDLKVKQGRKGLKYGYGYGYRYGYGYAHGQGYYEDI